MAKSLRSKVKRDFRTKKRETGIYAATAAARLNRLNAKLSAVMKKDGDGDEEIVAEEEPAAQDSITDDSKPEDAMIVEGADATPKRISTHGPRGSRREDWRTSKGLSARPKSKGMNRQGGIAAVRKSGRSKRRR